jgi:antitoxin MazE
MKVTIRKIGNSRGVIIPQGMLAIAQIRDQAEMVVEKGAILIRKPANENRAGWAAASKAIAAAGDAGSGWPEFVSDDLSSPA